MLSRAFDLITDLQGKRVAMRRILEYIQHSDKNDKRRKTYRCMMLKNVPVLPPATKRRYAVGLLRYLGTV